MWWHWGKKLLLLFHCLLSQAFPSWYVSSRKNDDPTAQGLSFRLQRTLYCVYVAWLAAFCSESVECFPDMACKFFLSMLLIFCWPQLLPV
jgi:hypothetical protein